VRVPGSHILFELHLVPMPSYIAYTDRVSRLHHMVGVSQYFRHKVVNEYCPAFTELALAGRFRSLCDTEARRIEALLPRLLADIDLGINEARARGVFFSGDVLELFDRSDDIDALQKILDDWRVTLRALQRLCDQVRGTSFGPDDCRAAIRAFHNLERLNLEFFRHTIKRYHELAVALERQTTDAVIAEMKTTCEQHDAFFEDIVADGS